MSQENVELARRTFEAFNRTYTEGTDDLYALLDPDIEWIPVTGILEGRSYHGHEGVRQWIEDMKRDWEAFEPRPVDFRDLGDDRVLALGSWHARGRGGNVPLDQPPFTCSRSRLTWRWSRSTVEASDIADAEAAGATPSLPFELTTTGSPESAVFLIPAMNVAVWLPLPIRIVPDSPATPGLAMSMLLAPVVRF